MSVKQITQSVNKFDTEKSKVLSILFHYLVILSISFSFTLIVTRQFEITRENGCKKSEIEEIEKIVGNYLMKNEFIQKVGASNEPRTFGYLHEDQAIDSPKKRVKKNVKMEDKGCLNTSICI